MNVRERFRQFGKNTKTHRTNNAQSDYEFSWVGLAGLDEAGLDEPGLDEAILGPSEAILEPSRAVLGPSRAVLGHLRAI